jgi:hypothetical protein
MVLQEAILKNTYYLDIYLISAFLSYTFLRIDIGRMLASRTPRQRLEFFMCVIICPCTNQNLHWIESVEFNC